MQFLLGIEEYQLFTGNTRSYEVSDLGREQRVSVWIPADVVDCLVPTARLIGVRGHVRESLVVEEGALGRTNWMSLELAQRRGRGEGDQGVADLAGPREADRRQPLLGVVAFSTLVRAYGVLQKGADLFSAGEHNQLFAHVAGNCVSIGIARCVIHSLAVCAGDSDALSGYPGGDRGGTNAAGRRSWRGEVV